MIKDYHMYVVSGLFIPLHFCSWERKVHRWNFTYRGTFIPLERKIQELSLHGTFTSVELFQELSLHGTFAPILKQIGGKHYSNLSVGIFWQW